MGRTAKIAQGDFLAGIKQNKTSGAVGILDAPRQEPCLAE